MGLPNPTFIGQQATIEGKTYEAVSVNPPVWKGITTGTHGTRIQRLEGFQTVADMRANVAFKDSGYKVEWRGYYTESDGGSNWGVVKTGDSTGLVDDGGSIFVIVNDAVNGLWVEANLKGKSVNVAQFGAKGDGSTDCTNAINTCIDFVSLAGGGVVKLQSGKDYKINTDNATSGVRLKSNITLDLNSSKLSAINSGSTEYRVVWVQEANNVEIKNGVIEGDKDVNPNTTGEQGHCIYIIFNCDNIKINNVTCTKAFGDGVYLGRLCTNIRVDKCNITHNRRNNVSIISPSNVTISKCEISHAAGTSPECGIDVEPNPGDAVATGILIKDCFIHSNNKDGIAFPAPPPTALIDYASVSGCHIYSNGRHGVVYGYAKKVQIENCAIYSNGANGIQENQTYTESTVISGNMIRDNAAYGLYGFTSNLSLIGNQVVGSGLSGVRWDLGSELSISSNTIKNSGEHGLMLYRVKESSVIGNVVDGSQKHGIYLTGAATSSVTRSARIALSSNAVSNYSLEADNAYDGIHGDDYVEQCTASANVFYSDNRARLAIFFSQAANLAVDNITQAGCKTGNAQISIGGFALPSFINNASMFDHLSATRVYIGTLGASVLSGSGSPEGMQSAPVGSLYLNVSGGAGTTFYVKESGGSTTGWVAK